MVEVNGVAPLRGFNCSIGKLDNVRPEGSERLILPVSAIRFSHDRISEKFSCGKSILQMVLELYAGRATWACFGEEGNGSEKAIIPIIAVTEMEGQWYALFGNRRLAAAKLLALYLPGQFDTIPVIFGMKPGEWMAQRFTTQNAGSNVIIKETSEIISNQESSYGTELCECLLPEP